MRERNRKSEREQARFNLSMASLCHPCFTRINLSYRFPIFETSTTALCGTIGNLLYYIFRDQVPGGHPNPKWEPLKGMAGCVWPLAPLFCGWKWRNWCFRQAHYYLWWHPIRRNLHTFCLTICILHKWRSYCKCIKKVRIGILREIFEVYNFLVCQRSRLLSPWAAH